MHILPNGRLLRRTCRTVRTGRTGRTGRIQCSTTTPPRIPNLTNHIRYYCTYSQTDGFSVGRVGQVGQVGQGGQDVYSAAPPTRHAYQISPIPPNPPAQTPGHIAILRQTSGLAGVFCPVYAWHVNLKYFIQKSMILTKKRVN